MKKLVVLLTLIIAELSCNAQISTFDKYRNADTSNKPIPIQYDSLTNIEFYNKNNGPDTDFINYYSEGERTEENLSHLINQRLYFYGDTAEMTKTSWLKFYRLNDGKNKKKYPYIYFPYTDFLNKYFTFVGCNIKPYEYYIFKLIPENESDTVYCRMNHFIRHDFWTVQGYYEKAKKDYLNKQFVLVKEFRSYEEDNWLYRLDDDRCAGKLPLNSIWECTDVTLKGYKNHMGNSIVILVFSNKELGNYYIYLDKRINSGLKARRDRRTLDLFEPKAAFDVELASEVSKYDSLKGKSFVYQNKYKNVYHLYSLSTRERFYDEIPQNTEFLCKEISFLDNDKNKLIFVLHSEAYGDMYAPEYDFTHIFKSKEVFLKAKEKEEQRRKQILTKYGQHNGQTILEGKVRIGFTKAMCIEAWGEPNDINKSSGSWGVHEQWCYSDGSYLYFENGKLTSIQN